MPIPLPKLTSSTTAANARVGIWTVSLTAFVIATLAWARALLIPRALAALLTFLLAPLVTRLERWLGRIIRVLWGATEHVTEAARRVRESGADEVFTTLAGAARQLMPRRA